MQIRGLGQTFALGYPRASLEHNFFIASFCVHRRALSESSPISRPKQKDPRKLGGVRAGCVCVHILPPQGGGEEKGEKEVLRRLLTPEGVGGYKPYVDLV